MELHLPAIRLHFGPLHRLGHTLRKLLHALRRTHRGFDQFIALTRLCGDALNVGGELLAGIKLQIDRSGDFIDFIRGIHLFDMQEDSVSLMVPLSISILRPPSPPATAKLATVICSSGKTCSTNCSLFQFLPFVLIECLRKYRDGS